MLQANHPMPLHIQLKQLIQQEIQSGKYTEKIPSERELMERFLVSRSTVREAINHLVNEQVLEKVHGKGTYIKHQPAIKDWLHTLHSFTETVKKMGMNPSAQLIDDIEKIEDMTIKQYLGEEQIVTFSRLRFANDQPIAVEHHYYGEQLGAKLSQFDLNTSTIYDLLEKQLNIALLEAEQTIKVISICEKDASHLNISPGINVLCLERILLSSFGQPIEFYRSVFHPDFYEFKLKTKRNP